MTYKISYRNVKVSYRNVKHPRLELKTGELLLVLPFGHDPDSILKKNRSWILKKIGFIEECLRGSSGKKIVDRTDSEFRSLVYSCVEETSKELSAEVNKIFFRKMKTKWASCSPKRNLTINRLMKYLPERLVKYIVFHEITHLIERRHNEKFWRIVSKRFHDYRNLEMELFTYWFLVHA
jgi:hypothetical protein